MFQRVLLRQLQPESFRRRRGSTPAVELGQKWTFARKKYDAGPSEWFPGDGTFSFYDDRRPQVREQTRKPRRRERGRLSEYATSFHPLYFCCDDGEVLVACAKRLLTAQFTDESGGGAAHVVANFHSFVESFRQLQRVAMQQSRAFAEWKLTQKENNEASRKSNEVSDDDVEGSNFTSSGARARAARENKFFCEEWYLSVAVIIRQIVEDVLNDLDRTPGLPRPEFGTTATINRNSPPASGGPSVELWRMFIHLGGLDLITMLLCTLPDAPPSDERYPAGRLQPVPERIKTERILCTALMHLTISFRGCSHRLTVTDILIRKSFHLMKRRALFDQGHELLSYLLLSNNELALDIVKNGFKDDHDGLTKLISSLDAEAMTKFCHTVTTIYQNGLAQDADAESQLPPPDCLPSDVACVKCKNNESLLFADRMLERLVEVAYSPLPPWTIYCYDRVMNTDGIRNSTIPLDWDSLRQRNRSIARGEVSPPFAPTRRPRSAAETPNRTFFETLSDQARRLAANLLGEPGAEEIDGTSPSSENGANASRGESNSDRPRRRSCGRIVLCPKATLPAHFTAQYAWHYSNLDGLSVQDITEDFPELHPMHIGLDSETGIPFCDPGNGRIFLLDIHLYTEISWGPLRGAILQLISGLLTGTTRVVVLNRLVSMEFPAILDEMFQSLDWDTTEAEKRLDSQDVNAALNPHLTLIHMLPQFFSPANRLGANSFFLRLPEPMDAGDVQVSEWQRLHRCQRRWQEREYRQDESSLTHNACLATTPLERPVVHRVVPNLQPSASEKHADCHHAKGFCRQNINLRVPCDDKEDILAVGVAVEAEYCCRGKFFPGVVERVNCKGETLPDGQTVVAHGTKLTYDIRYDDGDRESGVPRMRIRRRVLLAPFDNRALPRVGRCHCNLLLQVYNITFTALISRKLSSNGSLRCVCVVAYRHLFEDKTESNAVRPNQFCHSTMVYVRYSR